MYLRIPDSDLPNVERINKFYKQINDWISSEHIFSLVDLYGGDDYRDFSFEKKLEYLKSFSERHWDKRQKNKRERYEIKYDSFILNNIDTIIDKSNSLGMVSMPAELIKDTEEKSYDFVCPLGGYGLANLIRVKLAADIFNAQKNAKFYALSGLRPINQEAEKSVAASFSEFTDTEYDLINASIDKCFGEGAWKESSIVCEGKDGRRATTRDLYETFFAKGYAREKDRILFVSGAMVTVEQIILAFPFAIKYNVDIDVIGTTRDISEYTPEDGVKLLQEINAVIYNSGRWYEQYKEYLK